MRIKAVRIQNLRTFKDATVYLNDYTCLVGPNGAGKSTVLCALNIFFQNTENSSLDLTALEEEDFHKKETKEPVVITVTFVDLSPEAQNDFADYFRNGELVVSAIAEFDPKTGAASVKQFGQRSAMKAFAPFFEALGDGALVKDLKARYEEIRKNLSDLIAPGTKEKMTEALRTYETSHPNLCELIPSADQFYGISKGANRLAKYVQWVYLPAVKDATGEQVEERNTALGKLIARAVRSKTNFDESVTALRTKTRDEYQELLNKHQDALTVLSNSLNDRLKQWAHPEASLKVEWRQDPERSVRIEDPFAGVLAGEEDFHGNLARFGHGLQRSYLLALLQELAGNDDSGGPKLILACEEPELYQHPPQARHLAEVLAKLSERNSQIVVCTHSPYFVTGRGFEDVRMVRKKRGQASNVTAVSFAELAQTVAAATGDPAPPKMLGTLVKVHQALQPAANEIFFAPVLVLVEGLEDVAYVATYLHLLGLWDEYRRLGCHIIPTNGKSHMIQPVAVATRMRIPAFAVFDSDATQPDKNGSRSKHVKDNTALLKLCGVRNPNPLPTATTWDVSVVMWESDMGTTVAGDFDPEKLQIVQEQVRAKFGHVGGLEKNSLFIAEFLTSLWDAGCRSPTLEKLCREILRFAASAITN